MTGERLDFAGHFIIQHAGLMLDQSGLCGAWASPSLKIAEAMKAGDRQRGIGAGHRKKNRRVELVKM
jgi:hypothetical protein